MKNLFCKLLGHKSSLGCAAAYLIPMYETGGCRLADLTRSLSLHAEHVSCVRCHVVLKEGE